MTVKLVVLYPHPKDEAEFERQYVQKHLPLMRKLAGPDIPLPTYRTIETPERPAPYYRVAEIHFPNRQRFDAFVQAPENAVGRKSSLEVSTGGKPIFLVCEQQPEI
jgi:uncharacterized protein (TIGR02118 family)